MKRGILEALGGHETKQRPAIRVGGGLVGKIDLELAVVTEERRRVLDDASRRKPSARVGDGRYGMRSEGRMSRGRADIC